MTKQQFLIDSHEHLWYFDKNSESLNEGWIEKVPGFGTTTNTFTTISTTLLIPQIPTEITYMILDHYINDLIKMCQFDQVYKFCNLNKRFLKMYYHRFIGEPLEKLYNEQVVMSIRLSNTLEFADMLHETLMSKNHNRFDIFIFEFSKSNLIWRRNSQIGKSPFDVFSAFYSRIGYLTSAVRQGVQDQRWESFITGNRYGDLVWVQGQRVEQYYFAEKFERPIIIFSILNESGMNLTVEEARQIQSWKKFILLLKQAFGPATSINFVHEEEDSDEDSSGEYLIKEF